MPGRLTFRKTMGNLNLEYLKEFAKGDTFIETGTYEGDTVALADQYGFKNIHSIEIEPTLYELCQLRFSNIEHIKIWHGDSIDMLEKVMAEVRGQATFWLDAHASGPLLGGKISCPLVEEINIIGKHQDNHVFFIDDCRLFGSGEWRYLKKEDVVDTIFNINPRYRFKYLDGSVANDIMVAYTI